MTCKVKFNLSYTVCIYFAVIEMYCKKRWQCLKKPFEILGGKNWFFSEGVIFQVFQIEKKIKFH